MGQFWTVFNIDARERYSSSGWKLGEWLFQDHHDDLLELLRAKAPITMPKEIEKRLTEGKTAVQSSTLFKLPTEILDMILAELHRDDVLFMFAITCKAIFVIAERHLVKFYEDLFPSWRDCRIICVGEYMDEQDELPAGVLTESEREWVESERENWGSCWSIFSETFKNERFKRVKDFKSPACRALLWKDEAWGPHGYTSIERGGAYSVDRNMLRALHGNEQVSTTSRVDREVLCNVSKREYVRDVAIYDAKIPMCVTLAHALIVLICWSPWADYALSYDLQAVRDMKHGRWAGDRFRITTEDVLADLEDKGEEWTDVTEEAGVILRHLSKKNRGDWDWALEEMRDTGHSWPESGSSSDSGSCSSDNSDSESSLSDTDTDADL
ncbi:hypothetical protein C8Q73DRAFT_663128 [Cubamyces lactineus]|nr:hypothetical protein C8Q73DRAFT_663128 [Cubamyces lactineus]